MNSTLSFLTESSRSFEETSTVGGFSNNINMNNFDGIFTECATNMASKGIDVMVNINELMKSKPKMQAYKNALLGELMQECEQMTDPDTNYGTQSKLYEQVSTMFDNCVADFVAESTTVANLLPYKALDFPVLVKQYLKLATKDIIQTEVTKAPIIKKHIEQTWAFNRNNPTQRYKYPQCFFTDEFKELYKAGKGLPISDTPVVLPAVNYDVVTNLTTITDNNDGTEHYTMDLSIPKVVITVGDEDVVVKLKRPMRINLSDNTWLGGRIKQTVKNSAGETLEVDDLVTGMADMSQQTITLVSTTNQVKSVIFSGYLSNEKNMNRVSFDYTREEVEWKIEDGTRADMSFSLEQLEDAKALLNIDLYKKTYNHIADYMAQLEDSDILSWLDEQYDLYKGIEVNPLDWDGFITEKTFNCDSSSITTALPDEYINRMLKFHIDRIIMDVADDAKLEDMTFVIYGNPRLISLLSPSVNWVTHPGSSANGVKLDYGYGIMTSGDVKVQVVSTKKVNIDYDDTDLVYKGLRIIPFPLSQEQFTFKHYKYTAHVLTNQNSAYRDPQLPGGAMNYLVGVSRYRNTAIQGIQAQLMIAGAEKYISKKRY